MATTTITTDGLRSQSQAAAAVNFHGDPRRVRPIQSGGASTASGSSLRVDERGCVFNPFFICRPKRKSAGQGGRQTKCHPKKCDFFGAVERRKKQNSSKVSLYTDRHCRHLWNDGTLDGRWGEGAEPAGRSVLEEPVRGIFFIYFNVYTYCAHMYFFVGNVPAGFVIYDMPPPPSRRVLVSSAAQLISGKPQCDGNVPSAALPPVGWEKNRPQFLFLYCAVTGWPWEDTVRSLVTLKTCCLHIESKFSQ